MKGIIIVAIVGLVIFLAWFWSQTKPSDEFNGNGNGDDIPPDNDYNDTIPNQCEYNTGLGTIECHYEKTGNNTSKLAIDLPQHKALSISGEFKTGGEFELSTNVKMYIIDIDGKWHTIYTGRHETQKVIPFAFPLNYDVKRIVIQGSKGWTEWNDYIDRLTIQITYFDWRFA